MCWAHTVRLTPHVPHTHARVQVCFGAGRVDAFMLATVALIGAPCVYMAVAYWQMYQARSATTYANIARRCPMCVR